MRRITDLDTINYYMQHADTKREMCKVTGRDIREDVYFMLGEAGLYPCVRSGDVISCHAAILKKDRGVKAYRDLKDLVAWLKSHTDCHIICRIQKNLKHAQRFASSIGERVGSDENFIYYEAQR